MKTRIREIRENTGISQKTIAAYLMRDQSLYCKYELGKANIPIDVLLKLADYYDTSVDYLLYLSDKRTMHASEQNKE